MALPSERSKVEPSELREELRKLRRVDNLTNLGYLALDYSCLIVVIGGAILFASRREGWGLAWGWNVPIFGLAMILVGGLQHRLSGLAHEASHYSLLRNKFANDLLADVFCMFPIFSTVHFYRMFHFAHHQYTNDRERDPDLVNLGPGKRVDDFPMPKLVAIVNIYLRAIVFPFSFARYSWEYVYINSLGKGGNVYMKKTPGGDAESRMPRFGTLLGIGYLVAFNVVLWRLTLGGRAALIPVATALGLAFVAITTATFPERTFFKSPLRQPYSPRLASFFRLSFYTIAYGVLAHLRDSTGGRSAMYLVLLWYVPLTTTYMFFMLLRDIYQHTNADQGRLTNSRVFFVDAFTRWAVFVHGQDMHIPHHLYPAVPHYHLPRLHAFLKETHEDYAAKVVECHGTFVSDDDRPTILDVLTMPRESDGDRATTKTRAEGPHLLRIKSSKDAPTSVA